MNRFEVKLVNYFEKEEAVAEIYYASVQWAQVRIEKRVLIAEFYSHPNKEHWEFLFDEAMSVLEQAKTKLLNRVNRGGVLHAKTLSNAGAISEQGQVILEEILNDPNKKVYQLPNGNVKVFSSNGRGAHFKNDNTFVGFIEEKYEKEINH